MIPYISTAHTPTAALYAPRGPKLPCTSRRMRRAFRARILDISSGCDVKVVSTSLGSSLNGYYSHTHQFPDLRDARRYCDYLLARTTRTASAVSFRLFASISTRTHLVQIFVCDEGEPELGATPDDAGGSALEERLEAFFPVWRPRRRTSITAQ